MKRPTDLGAFIRQMRMQAGWPSLRGLARKLEISASYLSDIERNNRVPSDRVMRLLAKQLDTGYSDLTYDLGPTLYDALLNLSGKMSKERQALLKLYRFAKKYENGGMVLADSVLTVATIALWGKDEEV